MIDPNEDFEQPIPEPEPGKTAGIGNPRRPAPAAIVRSLSAAHLDHNFGQSPSDLCP
jgi:hypothetical protein